jgi:hypothetical protein
MFQPNGFGHGIADDYLAGMQRKHESTADLHVPLIEFERMDTGRIPCCRSLVRLHALSRERSSYKVPVTHPVLHWIYIASSW